MRRLTILCAGVMGMALASLAGGTPALAGTFVYVSNAEDGDISTFTLKPDGELQAGDRVKAASVVMPMAVSPDRRFLYAASRSKPFSVHVYAIDPATGGLKPLATSPLAESFPYISLDRTGRFLFGASYAGALVSVNAVGADGRVAADASAGDSGRPQRALDPRRRHQQVRLRPDPGHRSDLPVHLRRGHGTPDLEHPGRRPAEDGRRARATS